MSDINTNHTGIIAWFANNPVAANLLMIMIFVVGGMSAMNMQRTIQPELETNIIRISMVYPGAAPEEVERGIVLKIEESIKDIESIKRVESTADESLASLTLETYDDFDVLAVLDEVKSAVDAINSFPAEAEKAVITRLQIRTHAINVNVYGNLDEAAMKDLTENIKDEMLQDPDIAYGEVFGARNYEISVEVSEQTLRKYNLTLEQVAQAIRDTSVDLPGGAVKTDNGEIMVRTKGQAYRQFDFEQVVLMSFSDGTRLTLGDIATINDGFVEAQGFSIFDNSLSMGITLFAVGNQDMVTVANATKRYVDKKKNELPPGVYMDYWADVTYYLQGRLDMMLSNLLMGALLVFMLLGLFLNIKLAFWVMAGLPVCFLGTFALMPLEYIDVTINMISLFGFILVLGIVVDDAIIIGESANTVCEEKGHSVDSVVEGALRVATPATFGVLTTIVAFAPTLFTEGILAPMPAALGWVVILCLIFSLVESKWILPAHLAHSKPATSGFAKKMDKLPAFNNRKLREFIEKIYQPFLIRCINNRYITLAVFLSMMILIGGAVAGGLVRYVLIPAIPGDFIKTDLEMIEGTADWQTRAAHDQIAAALDKVNQDYKLDTGNDIGLVKHSFSWGYEGRFSSSMLELTHSQQRSINSDSIVEAWRKELGEIPGAKVLAISNAEGMGGPALGFKLIHRDMDTLKKAAGELETELRNYNGIYDIRNAASAVRDEISLSIKPSAEAMGLSLSDLGRQVRHAFYGAEAQRIQRGTNEVKVMVRYPAQERTSISDLENMYIRGQDNNEIPFSAVADIDVAPGYSKTTRINGERAIKVSSEVNKTIAEPSAISKHIIDNFIPQLQQRYPGLEYKLDGESEESAKLIISLFGGFGLALLGVYALLAIPLKSYLQPLIIMGVIPFGIIGAMVGHMVVDIPFDMMSFFGIIALSGVVVNDSLIMVDFVNKSVAEGKNKFDAIIHSGSRRFRAILLTSLTTFFGLLPMLLETSVQAQHVVPMAVSLGFGIMFATVITLLLIPCLYIVLDDLERFFSKSDSSVQSKQVTE